MSVVNNSRVDDSVHERLLEAAFELFLHNDYNKVTTRLLAEKAGTSSSMIQYYFGGKQKLYEEMVRQQFKAIGRALEASYSEERGMDFKQLMLSYLEIHNKNPDFPAFITKILAYKNGPGYMLFAEILDNKRDLIEKLLKASQSKQLIDSSVEVDVLRILMMSLTVFPFLIKGVLEHSTRMDMDEALLEKVAVAAGEMLTRYTRSPS